MSSEDGKYLTIIDLGQHDNLLFYKRKKLIKDLECRFMFIFIFVLFPSSSPPVSERELVAATRLGSGW